MINLSKKLFCEFLLDSGALKICSNPAREDGCFVLKSGRISPFFMNLGDLNSGKDLITLGTAYADAIDTHYGMNFDVVFGPAYKGIPLAAATAMHFQHKYNYNVDYCCNRKEIKDHGDGGIIMGHKLRDGDRVVIVEDVTTSGKSIEETLPILQAQAKVEIVGLITSFDRLECGHNPKMTALEEISQKYGIGAHAIVSMRDVIECMHEGGRLSKEARYAIAFYYSQYGPEGITDDWKWIG